MDKRPASTIFRFFNARKPVVKKLLLFFAGIFVIIVFFLLPPYREWLNDRIIAYCHDFTWQKNKMDLEQRKVDRFEDSYSHSRQIAAFFEKRKSKPTALVLIPPTDYFKQNNIEFHVPEPVVFYYYTGLKTVWPNSNNAKNANWYVHVTNGQIAMDSVTDKNSFSDTLTAFNKFDISL